MQLAGYRAESRKSSTTNETLASGDTVALGLKNFFPQLTQGDIRDLEQAFPSSNESDPLTIQTVTGASSVRCAVSFIGRDTAIVAHHRPFQRDIFVKGISPHENVFAYRYNQPNPTARQPGLTAHAAENWMLFLGARVHARRQREC